MYSLLAKLMVIAALMELGISFSEFSDCHSRECIQKIEKRSRDVLKIAWKPISVFPKEAQRFH